MLSQLFYKRWARPLLSEKTALSFAFLSFNPCRVPCVAMTLVLQIPDVLSFFCFLPSFRGSLLPNNELGRRASSFRCLALASLPSSATFSVLLHLPLFPLFPPSRSSMSFSSHLQLLFHLILALLALIFFHEATNSISCVRSSDPLRQQVLLLAATIYGALSVLRVEDLFEPKECTFEEMLDDTVVERELFWMNAGVRLNGALYWGGEYFISSLTSIIKWTSADSIFETSFCTVSISTAAILFPLVASPSPIVKRTPLLLYLSSSMGLLFLASLLHHLLTSRPIFQTREQDLEDDIGSQKESSSLLSDVDFEISGLDEDLSDENALGRIAAQATRVLFVECSSLS